MIYHDVTMNTVARHSHSLSVSLHRPPVQGLFIFTVIMLSNIMSNSVVRKNGHVPLFGGDW